MSKVSNEKRPMSFMERSVRAALTKVARSYGSDGEVQLNSTDGAMASLETFITVKCNGYDVRMKVVALEAVPSSKPAGLFGFLRRG